MRVASGHSNSKGKMIVAVCVTGTEISRHKLDVVALSLSGVPNRYACDHTVLSRGR